MAGRSTHRWRHDTRSQSNPAHSGALATTRVFAFGREGTDQPDLYRSFIAQTLPTELPADVHLLETRLNESKHADAATRAAELVAVGFGELMEGFREEPGSRIWGHILEI